MTESLKEYTCLSVTTVMVASNSACIHLYELSPVGKNIALNWMGKVSSHSKRWLLKMTTNCS